MNLCTSLLEITESNLNFIQDAKLFFMIALALASLLVPIFKGNFTTDKSKLGILSLSTFLAIGGTACCGINSAAPVNPFPSAAFGLSIAGIGAAIIFAFMARAFFDIGTKATTISVLAGYMLSTVLTHVIWGMPVIPRYCLTLLLPALHAVLLANLLIFRPIQRSSSAPASRRQPTQNLAKSPLPVALLIVVLLSGFLGSFVRGAMYFAGADYSVIAIESPLIRLAVLAVITLVLGIFGKEYDTFSIFWPWAALPMVVCCVVIPFFGESSPVLVGTIFTVAHNLFNAFNYTLFVDLASRYDRDPIAIFSWGRSFDATGCVIGFASGALLAGSVSISMHLWYMLAIVSLISMIALFALVLLNRHVTDFGKGEAADGNEPAGEASGDNNADLGAEYGLTDRELEVLGLLEHGRSIPYIAEELLISTSTVKTHVQSIYRKLDVHTRQEFLDAVRKA